jgi:hypothetical protein
VGFSAIARRLPNAAATRQLAHVFRCALACSVVGALAALLGSAARGSGSHVVHRALMLTEAELRALLVQSGCKCDQPPAELGRGHEQRCPMWREPEPLAPAGARDWLAELLRWCVRTTDVSRRAEQSLGNLCDATRLPMAGTLALFRDLRACELHLVFVGGCAHCRLNLERRSAVRRALRERVATLGCPQCGNRQPPDREPHSETCPLRLPPD